MNMKLLKFMVGLVVGAIVMIICPRIGFTLDVSTYCSNVTPISNPNAKTKLKNRIAQYPANLTPAEDGSYILCLQSSISIDINETITITGQSDKPLLIYGLNLKQSSAPAGAGDPCTNALITISGAGITLQNATLAGPDACTGIKVDAKDVTVDTANISKFATAIEIAANAENAIIHNSIFTGSGSGSGTAIQVNGTAAVESSTISNFATGINVAKDANFKSLQNKFEKIIYEKMVSFDASVQSPIVQELIGKHVSETDNTKVDYVVTKLDLVECVGSVGMYYVSETDVSKVGDMLFSHPTASCTVAPLAEDTKLKFGIQDGEEKEETISKDTCAFKCADFSEGISTQVTFAYTSADGKTYPFAPMPIKKFSDLPDVITVVPLPTGQTIGTLSMTGETVFVNGYAGNEAESTDTGNNTGTNELYVESSIENNQTIEQTSEQENDDSEGQQPQPPKGINVTQGVSGVAGCSLIRQR